MKILEKQPTELLIATRNPGKIAEFRDLLRGLPFTLAIPNDIASLPEIEETGATFGANARLKAIGYAKAAGLYTIADDSGLEIDALGGAPGVRSARYAGKETLYDVKISRLLVEMNDATTKDRSARFVAHIVMVDASGAVVCEADGVCEGTIADRPRGSNGFGYDPIFVPIGFTETFGELEAEVKESISHRARALKKIIRFLREFA